MEPQDATLKKKSKDFRPSDIIFDPIFRYSDLFNSDPAARGTGLYIALININWGNRLLQVYCVNWSIILFS